MFGIRSLPRTLEAALRDMRHAKNETRISALRDLARLAETDARERALAALCEVMISDADLHVRAAAALALGDARATESRDALLDAARSAPVQVREMALAALGEIVDARDEVVVQLLEEARNDAAPELRFQALIAQNRVCHATLLERLIDATRDADAEVRQIAYRLAEEHVVADGAPLPEPLRQRARAALRDDVASVRLAAAILLARVGDASGAEVICAVVKKEDRVASLEDEQAALELAGELQLTEARAALSRRAFGFFGLFRDPLSWHARVALARLGDEQAKTAILRGLSAFTRDARTIAVAAAGRARIREARPILRRMTPAQADPETVREALAALETAP
ncbi:MAG TPA: HEAT repeat domain-containing protein [Polyangiaceae bacterium]|jgi:HEAT repeat protein|nr:HEAT repeat domain-containing protein [Polyangiaceae bacterium]